MQKKPFYYHVYLLTVWHEHTHTQPALITWRFRLEDPRTGRHRLFADAATLMRALYEIAIDADDAQAQQGGGE